MLTVVRHNRTHFNEDGKERLRGWLNIPLSKEGELAAYDTAKKLKDLGLKFNSFHTSPLKRSVQTADSICDELDMNYETSDKLKDWNTGFLTGKPVESSLPKIHSYMANPSEKIPEGESFRDFYNRDYPFLKKLVESDDNHLVVTHNRVTTLLKALCANGGSKPDMNVLKKKGPIEPGGIMMIDPDWSMSIIYSPKEKIGVT